MPAQTISPVLTDNASVQDMGPGGVLNQLPSLKATADTERTKLTVLNDYKDTNADRYGTGHPNALSDGDGFLLLLGHHRSELRRESRLEQVHLEEVDPHGIILP